LVEFTGERVVPGQVDIDLWNEHIARYHFARRLARARRVLDLGCGTGYGAAALTGAAQHVTGVDVSTDAIAYASSNYTFENLTFAAASCTSVPLPDASFDLITAFELIEHLDDPRALLAEARRLLAPSGQFIVSTPNRLYYAETRRQAGPNPFHHREYNYDEFRELLAEFFPHTTFFVQNHSAGVVFQPIKPSPGADLKLDSSETNPATSHFFLAVCACTPQIGGSAFIYLPTSANVLREREIHIARLEKEVGQKTEWLTRLEADHGALAEVHEAQKQQLEDANRWAQRANAELEQTAARVVEVQNELAATQAAAAESTTAYEAKISELDTDLAARTRWAQETEQRLNAELAAVRTELARCVELLDAAEKTVVERTLWAQRLEAEEESIRTSRWVRLGKTLRMGPAK